MPGIQYYSFQTTPTYQYLQSIFDTVLIKDVVEYNQIRDIDAFNRMINFVLENISHTFSAQSIRRYFRSENRNVSVDTILNYLSFCNQAFLMSKVPRFDAIGKTILAVEEKYYVVDHGLRQARGFSNQADIERVLENIVYFELLYRGYKVWIGKVGNREIDFVCEKEGALSYYQVTYRMDKPETRQREFDVYDEVTDNYPKFVLSLDDLNFSTKGIIHRNLIEWLMNP